MKGAAWVKIHAVSLFTILTLALGSGFLAVYFVAPESQIAPPKQGFGVAMTDTIRLDLLWLSLDPQSSPPLFWIQAFWSLSNPPEQPKPAYIMFAIPFYVEAVTVYQQNRFDWRWNVSSAGAAATAIYAKLSNDSLTMISRDIFLEFRVERTFEASRRGIQTIVLPLEAGVGGDDFPEIEHLQRQLQVGFVTPPVASMEVYIGIPISAQNLQAFPEPNSRTPFFRRSDNQTINSIQWVLSERKTITLSYVDQQTTSLYEFSVLLGGLLLGTGVSGFLNWLTDASAKARRWNPGTRHPQRQLAVQSDSIPG
jgi:hypothetical protein